MASTQKQVPCDSNNNGSLRKRKKSRGSRGSYLSKWLDKAIHNVQESTPSMDTYDSYVSPNINWQLGSSQFAPGYDSYRHIYGCTTEPLSLPTLPSYCNTPMHPIYGPEYRYVQNVSKSVQVQRPRIRHRCDNKPEEVHSTPHLPEKSNYLQPKNLNDSQDFASLPPIVTSVTDTNSNSDMNTNEKDDGNNRRYSDPCVRGLPDVARPGNGEANSESEASSGLSGSQVGSRLLSCLLDQISTLKIANERLNKDLMDTKAELENVRQHNIILQKGSSSSIGATPNHTSYNDNGLLGGQYGPGFLTDLVREIRDAARMREEALCSRVRAMVIERTNNGMATSAEAKCTEKALEEIKSSLRAAEADKRLMMDRIVKLEEELRLMRVTNGIDSNDKTNGNIEDAESERVRLRKELTDIRKAKQNAEEHALKLERLVTQLRSKFNGLQLTNGPDSLPSDPEHETGARARRTSANSINSTVVFGPVTDL